MKELSLFSGAGGGLLGTKLLGFKHIGYVEFNNYCQRIIRQRILDGILDEAPIFSDIRAFISEGYADSYKGMVDVITAGFPCQPFSVAGKQAGADDPRNMWPSTIATICTVRPKYAFLENVPGLISSGYFPAILRDLAESGYDVRWCCLSAARIGANHKRERLWMLATNSEGEQGRGVFKRGVFADTGTGCEQMADSRLPKPQGRDQIKEGSKGPSCNDLASCGGELADTSNKGIVWRVRSQENATRQDRERRGPGDVQWWATEPAVGRVADGVASRVDRLKAIGNGQVPAVVATAWRLLNEH